MLNPDEMRELAHNAARSIATQHLEFCFQQSPTLSEPMSFNSTAAVLPTPKAAVALGISVSTLNRYCTEDVGMFKRGEHWSRRTPHENATKIFNLRMCVETMQRLGYSVPIETLESLKNAN